NGEITTINLDIPDAKTKLVGSYTGTDGNKYVVALIPPKKWEVGMNDLEILISQNNMMTFPPVNDFKIDFSPEMPSMGHGSPNNVHPVNIGNGRYKGKVNYTMTGDWRFHFKLSKNDVVIVENATIDILF
ncbi:MAG: FixH family protein, partial [Ginsengibacter sp.]